jgi:predicted RNA-binding Zn ribbon-like protein
VQAFLNSFWDLDGDGSEVWSTPGAYGAWLRARGFDGAAASPGDLGRALELREALRELCGANHDDGDAPAALAALDRIAHAVAPAAALAPSLRTGALDPAGDGPDAACALALGIVFAARADGSFARLKACPHAHCGWAFYDSSRNRSGQWCSMRICGNRTKGEAFRRRKSARRP